MDLNTTNINSILGNLSCCIGSLGLQAIQDAKLGNDKCYKQHLQDVVLLDNIYKILKKSYYNKNVSYIVTEVPIYKDINTPVGIAFYIDGELITYAETQYYSDSIQSGLDTIVSYVNATGDGSSLSYVITTIEEEKVSYFTITYTSSSCTPKTVELQLYTPICDSPPFGCDYDPSVGTLLSGPYIFDIESPGCCPEEFCYVSEDLETLYDMALKLCKICKNC